MKDETMLENFPIQAAMICVDGEWVIDEDDPFTQRVDIPVAPVAAMIARHLGLREVET